MKFLIRFLVYLVAVCWGSFFEPCFGADWPMWRYDASRTASSPETLPESLHLLWERELPEARPAFREARLQFDAGYEPIVLGDLIYLSSSRNDGVMALDTETGEEKWSFFTEGPVRFAPAAWRDRVFFGSDDGHIYCVKARSGELLWKFRAVPSQRKVLGNGRMISLWPVRGGVVVHKGKVYFAAGVWPLEGVFVYCLDGQTGEVVWRNDECSYLYGTQPHAAEALGGVTPQGYLVVSGKELIVPCGQALPARLDLETGKLKSFELPGAGRKPGGWFTSVEARRGLVVMDAAINRDLHEDKVYQGPGSPDVRSTITLNGKTHRFSDKWPSEVKAKVHTLFAANGKLFIVDEESRLYCFGANRDIAPRRFERSIAKTSKPKNSAITKRVKRILAFAPSREGYAWIRGLGDSNSEDWLSAFQEQSNYHFVVTDSNETILDQLRSRQRLNRDDLDLLIDVGGTLELPPYFASLIYSEVTPTVENLKCLRPYGGVGCFSISKAEHNQLKTQLDESPSQGFAITRKDGLTVIRRAALPGTANYRGGWSSPDERVRAPLGVLWFDDALGHFKRSPQPWFVDGVMVSYPKDWMEKHLANKKPPYRLLPPVFSDVYTGRVLSPKEPMVAGLNYPPRDRTELQPSQYRPPTQQNAWKPKQPILGERKNPLTGKPEPRAIPKSYGCDGGVDYGFLYTMRSGTPAFYDKRLESGTLNIAGPRSGCTNSIIPACGVLNVPFFYEGCTCSYPLPVGLALVSLPPEHEQWFSWGPGPVEAIRRIGINFGAPGDRMSPAGTLWLDTPSKGGPSPAIGVSIEPKSARPFYHHSLFGKGGTGWTWVTSSGIQGARTIRIKGLKPGTATVRLYFADPDHQTPQQREFDVMLNGKQVAKDLDVAQMTDGRLRGLVHTYSNVKLSEELRIDLHPHRGETLLSGVEIVPTGDHLDGFPMK